MRTRSLSRAACGLVAIGVSALWAGCGSEDDPPTSASVAASSTGPGATGSGGAGASGSVGGGGQGGEGGTPCSDDLMTDPLHCGTCGHDCLGGACEAGVCQAVTMAAKQTGPQGVAVDDTYVYWPTLDTGVYRCPLGDCPKPIPEFIEIGPSQNEVKVDEQRIYWARSTQFDGSSLLSCPIDGCVGEPDVVVDGVPQIANFTLTDTQVVFSDSSDVDGAVYVCDKTGCNGAPTVLATGQQEAFGSVVVDGVVYWVSRAGGTLSSCAIGGCNDTPTILVSNLAGPVDVASDGTSLFFTLQGGGAVMRCTIGDCDAPEVFADDQLGPSGIAVDGSGVYWVNFGNQLPIGSVVTCPLDGCPGGTPRVLSEGELHPLALALSDDAVFWVNVGEVPGFSGGALRRVAK